MTSGINKKTTAFPFLCSTIVVVLFFFTTTTCAFISKPYQIIPIPIVSPRLTSFHPLRATPPIDNDPTTTATTTNKNPFVTSLRSLFSPKSPPKTIETEAERQRRLRRERRSLLSERETLRALRVRSDALPYLTLLALQFLPLLSTNLGFAIVGGGRSEALLYFFGTAVLTVYVGGRQVPLLPDDQEPVSLESAAFAPIFASVSIAILYALLKFGIDPTRIYALAVTLFGALAVSDIGVPLLRNVLPQGFAEGTVRVPDVVAKVFGLEEEEDGEEDGTLPLDGVVALMVGIGCLVGYWAPVPMEQKFVLSNG